jgi:iron complex transport system permease protein
MAGPTLRPALLAAIAAVHGGAGEPADWLASDYRRRGIRRPYQPDLLNDEHLIVRELRVPRTLVALLAGLALGAAGTLMQALTRNPLAEPGLLGVNAAPRSRSSWA